MQIAKWNEINKSYIFAIRHFSAVRSNNLDIWTYLFQRQRPFTEKQEQEEKEVKEGIEEKKSVLQLHVPLLFMSPQYWEK